MNTNNMTDKSLKQLEKITGHKLTLSKLLLAIRQSEEYSQVEFAEKLGISKQRLCDVEHNRKGVSPKLAATYAEKLGYSKEQFVRLALQDMLDREQLEFSVDLTPQRHSHRLSFA